MIKSITAVWVAGMLGLFCQSAQARDGTPGQFDYYVLSLSWVPGFCSANPGKSPTECGENLAFGLHGLWPNYNNGQFPYNCGDQSMPPADIQAKYGAIYPDPSMMSHEWPKHGTCSGLAPSAYFDLSVAFEKKVTIPNAYTQPVELDADQIGAVRAAFIASNQGLTSDDFKVVTQNGEVTEVDFCLTKAGDFRTCNPS